MGTPPFPLLASTVRVTVCAAGCCADDAGTTCDEAGRLVSLVREEAAPPDDAGACSDDAETGADDALEAGCDEASEETADAAARGRLDAAC